MPNLTDSRAQLDFYAVTEMHVDIAFSEHCTLKGHRE